MKLQVETILARVDIFISSYKTNISLKDSECETEESEEFSEAEHRDEEVEEGKISLSSFQNSFLIFQIHVLWKKKQFYF